MFSVFRLSFLSIAEDWHNVTLFGRPFTLNAALKSKIWKQLAPWQLTSTRLLNQFQILMSCVMSENEITKSQMWFKKVYWSTLRSKNLRSRCDPVNPRIQTERVLHISRGLTVRNSCHPCDNPQQTGKNMDGVVVNHDSFQFEHTWLILGVADFHNPQRRQEADR